MECISRPESEIGECRFNLFDNRHFDKFVKFLDLCYYCLRNMLVSEMNVKFKVLNCDDVKQLSVPCDETVGDFIKRAQHAGLVPRVGISNITVCDQSGDSLSGDRRISFC